MIKQINPQTQTKQIYKVFQASYAIELQWLDVPRSTFPPLQRSVEQLAQSKTKFWGYYEDRKLVAVMEIRQQPSYTHICSLVVFPTSFRRGIATQLLDYAKSNFPRPLMVETGKQNMPAVSLYQKAGFELIKSWIPDHGIPKVRFYLERNGE